MIAQFYVWGVSDKIRLGDSTFTEIFNHMGIQRENGGYSASVEGYLIVDGAKLQLAKSNGSEIALVHPCELSPGTLGELRVIVDGSVNSRQVMLPDGSAAGQIIVGYEVVAPF